MMTEWTELRTLQDVAAAQARGDEIWCDVRRCDNWYLWQGVTWDSDAKFRSRPKKQTKTLVLREALCFSGYGDGYFTRCCSPEVEKSSVFVKWLNTPERIEEIEE